jgi:hypothetical protein
MLVSRGPATYKASLNTVLLSCTGLVPRYNRRVDSCPGPLLTWPNRLLVLSVSVQSLASTRANEPYRGVRLKLLLDNTSSHASLSVSLWPCLP